MPDTCHSLTACLHLLLTAATRFVPKVHTDIQMHFQAQHLTFCESHAALLEMKYFFHEVSKMWLAKPTLFSFQRATPFWAEQPAERED